MPNRTNYAKKKRHHQTFGFSAHPDKVLELKKLFFKTCWVLTQEVQIKEEEVIKLAKENGVPVRLGKRKIVSNAELLLSMINKFYLDNDIEDKWENYGGRMPSYDE